MTTNIRAGDVARDLAWIVATTIGFLPTPLLYGAALAGGYAVWLGDRRPIPLLVVGLAWTGSLLLAAGIANRLGLPADYSGLGWGTRHAVEGAVVGLGWGVATVLVGVPARLRGDRPGVGTNFVASHTTAR